MQFAFRVGDTYWEMNLSILCSQVAILLFPAAVYLKDVCRPSLTIYELSVEFALYCRDGYLLEYLYEAPKVFVRILTERIFIGNNLKCSEVIRILHNALNMIAFIYRVSISFLNFSVPVCNMENRTGRLTFLSRNPHGSTRPEG